MYVAPARPLFIDGEVHESMLFDVETFAAL